MACQVISYLLILDLVLRTWRPEWTEWDVWGMVQPPMPADILVIGLAGGLVHWIVMLRERTVGRARARWVGMVLVLGMLVAALVAVAIGKFMRL